MVPTSWLLVCTVTASLLKLFSADARGGFLTYAGSFEVALGRGEIPAPTKTEAAARAVIFNDRLDAALFAPTAAGGVLPRAAANPVGVRRADVAS